MTEYNNDMEVQNEQQRTGRKGIDKPKTNVLAKYMHAHGYETIEPLDFYRLIFPKGELAEWSDDPRNEGNDKWQYLNWIVRKKSGYRLVPSKRNPSVMVKKPIGFTMPLCDDLKGITMAIKTGDFVSLAPISYVGKHRSIKNARFLYALVIELDNLQTKDIEDENNTKRTTQTGLANLLKQCSNDNVFLAPSYIVCSGTGLHLYWLLDKPMPLYQRGCGDWFYWSELKTQMTKRIWNKYTTKSSHPLDIQYESLNQPFRVVGSKGKNGSLVEAFKITGKRYTMEELFQQDYTAVMPPGYEPNISKYDIDLSKNGIHDIVLSDKEKKCKELYPEWWDTSKAGKIELKNELKRLGMVEGLGNLLDVRLGVLREAIENAQYSDPNDVGRILKAISIKERLYKKKKKNGSKQKWQCNKALYDWWLNKIYTGVSVGHRYYCLYALAQFAIKCGIPYEKYEEDCLELFPMLADMSAENPFTEDDLVAALEIYDHPSSSLSKRSFIEKKTGIPIPPQHRNGNKRHDHLHGEYIKHKDRLTGEIDEDYYNVLPHNRKRKYERAVKDGRVGRPDNSGTKKAIIQEWRKNNPGGKKADCIRETGLSKPTVYKWWDC